MIYQATCSIRQRHKHEILRLLQDTNTTYPFISFDVKTRTVDMPHNKNHLQVQKT